MSESDSGVKDIAYGGIFAGTVAFLTNALRVMSDSASAWFSNGKAVSNYRWVSLLH